MNRIAAFVLAGGSGFATDAAVLLLLTAGIGLNPFVARLFSFAAAVCVTWAINRRLTFGPSGRSLAREGARYTAVAVAVGLFNYAAYAGLLLAFPALWPVAALAIASGAAMVLSFLGYSRLVFGR
ncbi:GtrA family protein [Mesorhizobium microcysteis]|jgi:putative flippase GtrA|uniref:GtrA family protein n=1 Tax=Neoaquamicrobium microcysteis TaxID=2682781 RepID=A0A5D4GTX5_9HYPH|nr:GtrA family protein [Mesorhizobium microcysteis]TYR31512.1 GtrA family protein [Mesorhizobium microcysteis]